VIFVVRNKWQKGKESSDRRQHLPSHLLTYASIDGQRLICAVPTDVQPMSRFHSATSQSEGGIYADEPDFGEYGSVTVAVEVKSNDTSRLYLLSCQHVLSPQVEVGTGSMSAGAHVIPVVSSDPLLRGQPTASAGSVGRSVAIGGEIRADGSPSFDVQFAAVTNRSWLKTALKDLNLSSQTPFVTSRSTLDQIALHNNFELLVPENHPRWLGKHRSPVIAAFSAYIPPSFGISYDARINGNRRKILVHHWTLVELRVLGTSAPERGDSGSPVVAYFSDGTATLVGMHIAASDDDVHTYLIPAWQLFDRVNYWRLPAGASLRPLHV
jgi:hypothetical protein